MTSKPVFVTIPSASALKTIANNLRGMQLKKTCRCCGQLSNDLLDMAGHIQLKLKGGSKLWDWFVKFNNFQESSLATQYSHICRICMIKLVQAYKFHQQCVMAEAILQDSLKEERNDLTSKTLRLPTFFCKTCQMRIPLAHLVRHRYLHRVRNQIGGLKHKPIQVASATQIESNGPPSQDKVTHLSSQIRKQHEIKTAGRKPRVTMVACKICGKLYCANSISEHIRRTHKEKEELCTICGALFAQPKELARHITKHSNPTPFECGKCGKKYSTKHSLAHHMRAEHDCRTYTCEICNASFKRKMVLRNHILLNHEGAKLRCHLCHIDTFTSIDAMVRHLKKVHQTGYDQTLNFILADNSNVIRNRTSGGTLIKLKQVVEQES